MNSGKDVENYLEKYVENTLKNLVENAGFVVFTQPFMVLHNVFSRTFHHLLHIQKMEVFPVKI
jgi:hypothetical protein